MIDPKLSLNEAIDVFRSYLFAKQDEIYEDPDNDLNSSNCLDVRLTTEAQLRVSKLINLEEYLNDAKDHTT